MRLLSLILPFVVVFSASALDLKPAAQAKLMKALLSRSNLEYSGKVRFLIVDPAKSGFGQDLYKTMSKTSRVKIAGKPQDLEVALTEEIDNSSSDSTIFYFVSEHERIPKGVVGFSNSKENLKKGCFASLTMEGTTPKVHMSLPAIKELGLSFPSKLMKMVTLVK